MECFVIIVNGWKPLTIITKHSILDVAAALDPPLITCHKKYKLSKKRFDDVFFAMKSEKIKLLGEEKI